MLQMTLHLTRSRRLWTLLLLGLEVLLLRSEKNATLTVSMEIHKGAIIHYITLWSDNKHTLSICLKLFGDDSFVYVVSSKIGFKFYYMQCAILLKYFYLFLYKN
jgi:hypothetical protein